MLFIAFKPMAFIAIPLGQIMILAAQIGMEEILIFACRMPVVTLGSLAAILAFRLDDFLAAPFANADARPIGGQRD